MSKPHPRGSDQVPTKRGGGGKQHRESVCPLVTPLIPFLGSPGGVPASSLTPQPLPLVVGSSRLTSRGYSREIPSGYICTSSRSLTTRSRVARLSTQPGTNCRGIFVDIFFFSDSHPMAKKVRLRGKTRGVACFCIVPPYSMAEQHLTNHFAGGDIFASLVSYDRVPIGSIPDVFALCHF